MWCFSCVCFGNITLCHSIQLDWIKMLSSLVHCQLCRHHPTRKITNSMPSPLIFLNFSTPVDTDTSRKNWKWTGCLMSVGTLKHENRKSAYKEATSHAPQWGEEVAERTERWRWLAGEQCINIIMILLGFSAVETATLELDCRAILRCSEWNASAKSS